MNITLYVRACVRVSDTPYAGLGLLYLQYIGQAVLTHKFLNYYIVVSWILCHFLGLPKYQQ